MHNQINMEGNFSAIVSTQQDDRRLAANQACFTRQNRLWSYPTFYPRVHTSSCSEFGACTLCQPLPSFQNYVPMYVPEQPTKSNRHNADFADDLFPSALLPSVNPMSPVKAGNDYENRYLPEIPALSPPRTNDRCFRLSKAEKHECQVPGCGKSYERLSHLKAHIRWHGNPAPFKCRSASCGKRFSSEEKLVSHMKLHAKTS